MGGRRVAASGSMQGLKGDVTHDSFLIEAKSTKTDRYNLTSKTWRTIEYHANLKGKRPLMVIDLDGRRLVVIGWDDFLEIDEARPNR